MDIHTDGIRADERGALTGTVVCEGHVMSMQASSDMIFAVETGYDCSCGFRATDDGSEDSPARASFDPLHRAMDRAACDAYLLILDAEE